MLQAHRSQIAYETGNFKGGVLSATVIAIKNRIGNLSSKPVKLFTFPFAQNVLEKGMKLSVVLSPMGK